MEAIVTLPDGRRARITGANQEAIMAAVATLKGEQTADKSPFPVEPPPQTNSLVPPVAPMGVPMVGDQYSPEDRAAAASGVDVKSGGGIDRTLLGFAPNESFEQSFTQDLLRKRYGKDVAVRVGEKSKQIEFLSPKTNRWTTIDEAGFSRADLKDMYGPGIATAGAAVGGVVGSSGGTPGIAAGGGIGSALGDYLRLSIGKRKGVHNMSEADMMTQALKTGGLDVVFGSLGDRGVKLLQLMSRFKRPNPIPPEEAKIYLEQMEQQWKEVEELTAGGAEGFKPTIPNIIGNEKLGAELTTASQGNRQSRRELSEIDQRNASAMDKYFDTQFSPSDQAAQTRVGSEVQGATAGSIDQEAVRLETEGADQLARVRAQTGQLPVYDEGALGDSARRIVSQARERLAADEKKAWKAYESAIGLDETGVSSALRIQPSPEFASVVKTLSAEKQAAMFGFQARQTGAAIPNIGDGPIDLADLDRALKSVRARIRDQKNGAISSDISTYDLERISGALADERARFLAKTNPDALKALEAAEAASRLKHDTVDNSSLGFILRKQGDSYVLYNDEVFRKIFLANDVNAVRELVGMATEPGQKAAIQRAMLAMYREEAMDAGIPKPALHDKFLSKYGDMMKVAFGKDYMDAVVPFGKMGEAIVRSSEQAASHMKFLRTGLSKQITSANPDRLISDVVFSKDMTLTDVGKLAAEMKRMGNYQAGVDALGGYIRRKAVDSSGQFSEAKLRELAIAHASALDAFAGPGYSKKLLKMANGLRLAKPAPAGARREADLSLYQIMRRAIIPPLSREGRVVTVVRQGIDARADRVMFEIMTDPEKLREFVRLGDRRVQDRQVAAFLASVGGASLASEALNE